MTNVLIVGHEGQLGRELLRLTPEGVSANGVDVNQLDVTDNDAVQSMLRRHGPDVIINASAYTAVDQAEKERDLAFAVNQQGVAHLAAAARDVGARVIHVSTDYVFNGENCRPWRPTDRPAPINVYGESKLAGERELASTLPETHVIVRTAWLYSTHGNNFVKTMIRLMREREELAVVADQFGTPTCAGTLAGALWAFTRRPDIFGIFHWTDAGAASWFDFAYAIRHFAAEKGLLSGNCRLHPITSEKRPTPARRPAFSVLDKTSTMVALDLTPPHWIEPLINVLDRLKE